VRVKSRGCQYVSYWNSIILLIRRTYLDGCMIRVKGRDIGEVKALLRPGWIYMYGSILKP
jgi:hypothetical protein